MTTTKFPVYVWISILLTAILSFVNIWPRFQVEQGNKAVTIVVEADVVDELSATQRMTFAEGLNFLKDYGVGAVACNERTAGELLSNGLVNLSTQPDGSYELTGSEMDIESIAEAYAARFGTVRRTDAGLLISDPQRLRLLTIGLNPRDVEVIRQNQLPIVARLGNPTGVLPNYVHFTIQKAAKQGAKYFLPLGEQVLGNQALIKDTSEALKANGMVYVTAEFVKIAGDSTITGLEPENAVRLHAAQSAELIRMSQSAIVERYVKAARERNIRLLLVRPAGTASETPLNEFSNLIRAIRDGIAKDGMAVKPSRPFTEPQSNTFLKLALGIAMIPALGFCLLSLAGNWNPKLTKPAAWLIAGGVGLATYSSSLREYSALAGSILFPVLAYFWFLAKPNRNAVLSYAGISAISLVGGLQIAGLLTALPYMLHLNLFTGVKLSVFLPIFIAGFLMMNHLAPVKKTLNQPVVWGTLFAAIFGLGMLAFMNSRTGNDNPAGVSGLELQFRNILDQLLFARPRTKEFMIGHPMLLFGLLTWARAPKGSKWYTVAALLIALGAIGQTSVVNTFCHIHTPIDLSIGRVITGHIAGCIIGALGWVVLHRFVPKATGEDIN
ncbi:MAG: hypothetical protein KF824_09625 [Fimbriimonadaceae bacterium]|nr:MAG: hypothetical protein KF824_09625 [Fimbriimonadaceae bacterium]